MAKRKAKVYEALRLRSYLSVHRTWVVVTYEHYVYCRRSGYRTRVDGREDKKGART